MKRILKNIFLIGLGLFIAIQLVPYGHNHQNPPVESQPQWDSPRTEELARRACFDCHSNESVWPWYSNIAPVSWLVYHDVEEGRQYMNFSKWDTYKRQSHELPEVVAEGYMPLPIYLVMHPEADLTNAEKQELIQGFQALGN